MLSCSKRDLCLAFRPGLHFVAAIMAGMICCAAEARRMTQPSNLPPQIPKPRRSRLATVSLVLTFYFVAFLFCVPLIFPGEVLALTALVALFASPILAIMALVAIRKSRGRLVGGEFAFLAIALSVASFLLVGVMVFAEKPHAEGMNSSVCSMNLREIGKLLMADYRDNDRCSRSLDGVCPKYTRNLRLFECPSDRGPRMKDSFDERLCSYRYIYYPSGLPGFGEGSKVIWVFEKCLNHKGKGINTLFVDGHTAFLSKEELIATLRQIATNEKLPAPNRDSVRKTLAEVLAESSAKR